MAILASTIIKKGARPPRVPSRSLNEIHRLGWRSHSDEWLIKKRSEYISDITSTEIDSHGKNHDPLSS
jgi:hypothetical protein